MTIDVMLDYPQRHRVRRPLRRLISTVVGALLVLVAAVTTLALLPAGFFVLGILAGAPPEDLPGSDSEILLATAALIAISVGTGRAGVRLLRGNRELVLFLRRFGYRDATSVASFAATKTIGRSWRLVTLDDAAVSPVGVGGGMTGMLQAGNRAKLVMSRLARIGSRVFFIAWWGSVAIFGFAYLQTGSFEPYVDILKTVAQGHVPAELGEATLAGAVAAAIVSFAAIVIGFCALGVVVGAGVVLSPILIAGALMVDVARKADSTKHREVASSAAIDAVAHDLDVTSKRVLAPRLVVLRVATEVWQQTVRRLAFVSSLTIIDVSEPTENLLWEVQELADRLGPRCVFVGHQDRITELTESSEGAQPLGSLGERLVLFLEGREVLVYNTDPRAVRRFARALRAKLLDVAALSDDSSEPELQTAAVLLMAAGLPPPAAQPYTKAGLRRLDEELAGCDAVVERDGAASTPAQRERVSRALANKAFTLGSLGRHEEQLAVYDDILARYSDAPEPALREHAAEARAGKIIALGAMGRREEQLVVYDAVVECHETAAEPALRERVAGALADKAGALGDLGRSSDALSVCDEVAKRFGDDPALGVRDRVAQALVIKGVALASLGRPEEAVVVCDDIVARYEHEREPILESRVAAAMVAKGTALGKMGRCDDAFVIYDDVIERYGLVNSHPVLRQAVATAMNERYLVGESRSRLGYARAVLRATLPSREQLSSQSPTRPD